MAEAPKFNLRNPAVKRIMQEIKEIRADTSGDFLAEALESDIFEWHFVIRGPRETEFEGGIYHGRILLPAEYPFKPPSFMMLTPNGRFETNMKICLSISSHHPEHWQPSWSVRTALMALIAFMPSPGNGALGAIDFTKDERRILAARSRTELPRFGSAERQRVIDDMHARMLAVEADKEAERAAAQAGGSNAGPSGSGSAPAQQTPRASIEQQGAPAGGEQGAAKAAGGEAAAGSSAAAPVVTAATATRTSSAGDAAASAQAAASAASPAPKPAAPAAAPAAEYRPAPPAAAYIPGGGYGAAGAQDMAAAAAAAAAGQAGGGSTGADHVLTALMWALYVGIGAILLRKVMGAMGVDLAELMRPY
ncbi:hypothetical protein HXX76_006198 [Chlamydomonas incerta]|uniref:UBC core domain-containing protein n=1 Tax=Chlamydomonas incerta TaxID=51695 RepID=A0A835TF47_CHLIN|nr:hypothetical protein HXX76_006198 [Chlamydomonas incerta]|eukprot:KAG2436670.1 hypothetical protein HXX76_006198 [Chlamydomonas incerta]